MISRGNAVRRKYEMVTGKLDDGIMQNPYWAGHAFRYDDRNYFEVWLNLFNEPWFLAANKDLLSYTMFKHKVEDGNTTTFKSPIGSGVYADKSRMYLNIRLPLLNPRFPLFLDLSPRN